jgi:hypothetical protein
MTEKEFFNSLLDARASAGFQNSRARTPDQGPDPVRMLG